MSNQLARREITPDLFQLVTSLAPTIHASRMFKGVASAEQAAVIMLKGIELGFPLTASFDLIEMIEGKAALKPQGMMARLHQSKNFDITVKDFPDGCEVWMRRRDTGFEYTAQFTKADAVAAGLASKNTYEKYAPDLYRARAIARCARVAGPDALAGMYLTAELHQEWTDGEIIEGEVLDG